MISEQSSPHASPLRLVGFSDYSYGICDFILYINSRGLPSQNTHKQRKCIFSQFSRLDSPGPECRQRWFFSVFSLLGLQMVASSLRVHMVVCVCVYA